MSKMTDLEKAEKILAGSFIKVDELIDEIDEEDDN